ncbi:alpha-galactosidase [Parasphingorhabdus sp.]|uniref:alpha-galactosidase n=1 Tax=Parasphingorhabdus sp. TaxID=2709688 RepID=UPI003263B8C2
MDHIRIDAGETSLILACAQASSPRIVHWGRWLSDAVVVSELNVLATRQHVFGSELDNVEPSLTMEPGTGFAAAAGLAAHRAGQDWGSRLLVEKAEQTGSTATILARDPVTQVGIQYGFGADPETGLLQITAELTNHGDSPLAVDQMATLCLPIPREMTDIISFSGRWAGEFFREQLARFRGTWLRENRRGRTSHDSFPGVILCEGKTGEQSGEAYGLHLAWSGNHQIRVDTLGSGDVVTSLGAFLYPGEIILAPGESYRSPAIVAGYTSQGLSALSRQFHTHARDKLLRPDVRSRPRPVHYNSWEAVYFDHDIDQLKAMASKAAEVGVERFVLDDGWFGSRRNDRSGLGDWIVSDDVYPEGLAPLVDHVTALGMEMGIWFEPEMVNPDSDLYRAHPDWVLQIEAVEQVPFRHQLVLDISRPEVADYLFEKIDAILGSHKIGYVKWDMNRDLNHPGGQDGQPNAFAQVQALYDLIERIRDAHPTVEIESCSSGGGRADFGILAHSDRIWTSDSNDARDRQSIQRGASFFFPLNVIGSHVGPRQCHITGRTLTMEMRAATAMIGHMGAELNLLTEPAADLETLKAAIALYKEHRQLLHSGDMYRLDSAESLNISGIVATDKSQALYSVACMTSQAETFLPRLKLAGLDAARRYRIKLIWPQGWRSITSPSIVDAMDLTNEGSVHSGEALQTLGLQLPTAFPETVLLFHLGTE